MLGLDWQEGETILPEDMNAAQCADLTRAYNRLQTELKKADAYRLPPMDVDAHSQSIASFAHSHPWTRPFLKKLLALPKDERLYDPTTVTTIVSDFHCRNYAFVGNTISALFDFDRLRLGSPVEDLVYAIIRRYRRGELVLASGRSRRHALKIAREDHGQKHHELKRIKQHRAEGCILSSRRSPAFEAAWEPSAGPAA